MANMTPELEAVNQKRTEAFAEAWDRLELKQIKEQAVAEAEAVIPLKEQITQLTNRIEKLENPHRRETTDHRQILKEAIESRRCNCKGDK